MPAKITIHTDARLRPIHLDKLVIDFKLTAPSRLYWTGRPAMRIVQALHWLHDMLPADGDSILKKIRKILEDPKQERRFATIFAAVSTLSPHGCAISSVDSFMTRISLARPTLAATSSSRKARLIGEYNSHIGYGQTGVQVVWNRVIYPDGSSLDLSGMTGQDEQGLSGFRDQVDHHYKRLLGFAVLSSLFAAASEVSQNQNRSVLTYPSPGQTAGSAVGQQVSDLGAQITRKNLNVQPTIKIPVGYQFNVRVNRDLVFDSAYKPSN